MHDQNFKNLILDYPREALAFFAQQETGDDLTQARIIPIRQEQLKDRLGDRFRELDKPLSLVEQLVTRTPLEQALAGELLVLIGQERAAAYDQELLKIPGGLWPRARATLLRLLTKGRAPESPAPLRHRAGLALGLLCYGPLESLGRPAAQVPMPDPRLPLAVIGLPAQRSTGRPRARGSARLWSSPMGCSRAHRPRRSAAGWRLQPRW